MTQIKGNDVDNWMTISKKKKKKEKERKRKRKRKRKKEEWRPFQ